MNDSRDMLEVLEYRAKFTKDNQARQSICEKLHFLGAPGPGIFHDFRVSPGLQGTILEQISAQLRKSKCHLSGAKHSPFSSRDQMALRAEVPEFSEIWLFAISVAHRKIFASRS